MSIEAGVLIDRNGRPIYWHMPKGASSVELPDSKDLWEIIWSMRDRLLGFAHTHPGRGRPSPSDTDLTTFAAIEAGLGIRLSWWIITDKAIELRWDPKTKSYVDQGPVVVTQWMSVLREASMSPEEIAGKARERDAEAIRKILMPLSDEERLRVFAMMSFCPRCGDDLRVYHFKVESADHSDRRCYCMCDE
jgi:hypothetical protein